METAERQVPRRASVAFRWMCLTLAVVATLWVGLILNDLRNRVGTTMTTVNEHLEQILQNTNHTTETLATLAADIKALRDLAGTADKTRDRSLVNYADALLDRVQASGGTIGIAKKIFGSGLKSMVSAEEWVVDARKEALWLSFRASSREELIERLCTHKLGSAWRIQVGGQDHVSLREWLEPATPDTEK